MLIFISDGDRKRCCVVVDLEQGCYPQISSHTCTEEQIEPSVWFKVLVLDSISIDCRKKEVSWTYLWKRDDDRSSPSAERMALTRRLDLFEMGRIDCYDFDDEAEEMFETARKLTKETDNRMSVDGGSLGKDDCGVLLQLLNSYLLPMVKFEVQSLPCVLDAYEDVLKSVALINQRVEAVSNSYAEAKKQLSLQLCRLFPHLESDLKNQPGIMDISLLQSIHEDVRKEEKRAQEAFQGKARAVERKRSENPVEGDKEMESLRWERKVAHDSLVSLLTCRETLHNAIERINNRPLLNKSMSLDSRYLMVRHQQLEPQARLRSLSGLRDVGEHYANYMKARHEVQRTFKQQQKIFAAKVLVANIRELLRETIEQLKAGVACEGSTLDRYGTPESDADIKKHSEWQVVKTKVIRLLSSHESPTSEQHHCLCAKIKKRLEAIAMMIKRNGSSSFHRFSTLSYIGNEADDGYNEEYDDADCGFDVYKDVIRPCISDVKKHSEEISLELAKALGPQYVNQYWQRKIQIRYDKHLYEEISPYIEAVYQAYCSDNRNLLEKLADFSMKDPQEMKIGIVPEEWHCVFDRHHARMTPVRPPRVSVRNRRLPSRHESQDGTWPAPVTDEESVLELTFDNYFGPVREYLEELLRQSIPLAKLQCLTAALRKLFSSMSTLRARWRSGKMEEGIGADDMLPILIVVLTRLNCGLVVAIKKQCEMLTEVVPDFLSTGCYGYALTVFTTAIHVLEMGENE
eukprot:m.2067 g.2067  ORF g.2067 m.2067 type:complete len:744 (+) comp8253_c0_seq1:92-2323(+)